MAVGRAREGALLVAEQDGFHQIFRDGAAIDRHEGLGAPLARAVDRARDQLFADARLARDQHRNGRGRGFAGGVQHRLHARAAGHDVPERERAGAAALDAGELALQRARHQRIAQRYLQAFGAHRLDHEVGRARAHHRHHGVDAAMGGLHDDRERDPGLAHARQHAQSRRDPASPDRAPRTSMGGPSGPVRKAIAASPPSAMSAS